MPLESKQNRRHLLQAAAPGQELVSSAFRDVAGGIEARGLEALDGGIHAIGTFLAAARDEDMVWSCNAFQILGFVDASTEQAPIAEHLRSCQCGHACLHAAHRQARH